MRVFRIIAISFVLAGTVMGTNPAPRMKQLKLGTIFYGSSDMAANTTRRQWIADRYSMVVGQGWSGGWGSASYSTVVNDLKSYNPYLRVNSYVVYMPFAQTNSSYTEDTSTIRAWAGTDARMDSMLITNGLLAGDTVSARVHNFGTTPPSYVRTTPGQRLSYTFFNNTNGFRLSFDHRYPRIGNFYAHWWMGNYSANLSILDGMFVDEETFQKSTGMSTAGIETGYWPLRNNTTGCWEYGAETWRRMKNPWSASLTYDQIRDSLSPLRIRNIRVAAESLQYHGLVAMMNPAGYIGQRDVTGSYGSTFSNWTGEGNAVASAYRGVMISEIGNNYLTGAGNSSADYDTRLSTMTNWYYQHRDSTFESFYWGPIIWSGDTSGLAGWGRPQMLMLAHFIECMYPGYRSSKTYFGLINRDGANNTYNVYHDVVDTAALFNGAWEKYFGVEKETRDSSQTGTDGAGQSYKIRKTILGRPDDTSKTLTFSALRYPSGTNKSTTTNISVTLPSVPAGAPHNWVELLSGGTYAASSLAGGATFNLRNIEARIFVSDTFLADSGLPVIPNVRYVTVDSITHDVSGERDSLKFRVKTNNVATNADSVIVAYSTSGLESIDSSLTTKRLAAAYVANSTLTFKDTITTTETDQIYVKAWTKSNTLGKLSEPVDAARTFSGPVAASTDTVITIGNASGSETNSGGWTMAFIVTMNYPRSTATTFTVNTANSTTTSGVASPADLTALVSQTETIEATDIADTVFVTIFGDTDFEADEVFTVTISSPSSPVILGSTTVGVGTITNDDAAPGAGERKVTLTGNVRVSGAVRIE